MPWIKVEHESPDKPEVANVAEALGIDPDDAFGKCVRFWIWCDKQIREGKTISVSDSFLDTRVFHRPGFSAALRAVGWLGSRGNVTPPNFDRHNGQTAKDRALTNDRVKRHRNGSGVTPSSLVSSRSDLPGFAGFWSLWPKHHRKSNKQACERAWIAKGAEAETDAVIASLTAWIASADWAKDGGGFIPAPLVWLNQERWRAPAPPPAEASAEPILDVRKIMEAKR